MAENGLSVIFLLGALQGVLLSLFLLLKKDHKINLPLILFVFLTSVELFFQYVYATKLIFKYPHLLYLSEPFSMLSGVLIFFYTRNILANGRIVRKTDLFFLVPFIVYVVYYFPSFNQSAEDKIFDIMAFYNAGISWRENLLEWIVEILVTIPFLVLSVKLLNKHNRIIKDNYSDIAKINYILLRNLIIASIVLYFLEITIVTLAFTGVEIAELLNFILYILLVVIVYVIGYDALVRKQEALKYVYIQKTDNAVVFEDFGTNRTVSVRKYEKNALSELRVNQIAEKIVGCINSQKPYRNSEIRLNDLSQLINEHPNNVSQVINDYFKKNFYDFINFYRVDEAKSLLKDPNFKNYTITAIGFEVGFNSKSAFYSSFKKFTDITPAQFQKSLLVE